MPKKLLEKLLKSIKPGDLVVKIVHESLIKLLSCNLEESDFELAIKWLSVVQAASWTQR